MEFWAAPSNDCAASISISKRIFGTADPMCVVARGGGGTDGCEGDGCCSSGTVFKDGKCVATYDGLLQACKDARGDWGWTCHADTDSCPK